MNTFIKRCNICRKEIEIKMTDEEFNAYLSGQGHIQDILPRLSEDERELLISGICGPCFDNLFRETDEDEDDDDWEDEEFDD